MGEEYSFTLERTPSTDQVRVIDYQEKVGRVISSEPTDAMARSIVEDHVALIRLLGGVRLELELKLD
ncbi:hypothetical protein FJZ17_03340 [Candidatus Pacearchaeota archaeon]|nr:hypothetical protein [Candidatus Pacearchaeota archaeon]